MNFKIQLKGLVLMITALETNASLTIQKEGNEITRQKNGFSDETQMFETPKEQGYANHLSKFIAEVLPLLPGSWEKRFEKLKAVLDQYNEVVSWRTLSNSVRRHFDDGTLKDENGKLLTQSKAGTRDGSFYARFFYEGSARTDLSKPATAAKKATPGKSAIAKKAAKAEAPAAAPQSAEAIEKEIEETLAVADGAVEA